MTDDLVQWNRVKGLERSHLDVLVGLRQDAKKAVEEAQAKLQTINGKILSVLATAEVKTVAVGETRVTFVAGGSTEKLDKKRLWVRLLELGVKEKVVEKAYKDSTTVEERQPYVLVTEPKPEKA